MGPCPQTTTGSSIFRRHRYGAALALITILAAVARLIHINQPIRFDEGYTVIYFTSHGLWECLSSYIEPNNHPLNSVLIWLSTTLFGPQPWAIRLPVLLAGVAMVPTAFVVARRLVGRRAAILAAGLIAGWPYLIHYSTNARGYIFQALAILPMMLLTRRLAERFDLRAILGFGLLAALGLWAVPTMLFAISVFGLWAVLLGLFHDGGKGLATAGRSLAAALAVTAVLTAILYSPVLIRFGLSAVAANKYVSPMAAQALLSEDQLDGVRQIWGKWFLYGSPVLDWVMRFLTGFGVLGLLLRRRKLLLLAIAFPLAAIAVMAVMRRYPPPRIFTFVVPAWLMLSAVGVDLLIAFPLRRCRAALRYIAPPAAVAISAALTIWAYRSNLVFNTADTAVFPQAQQVSQFLKDSMADGDALAITCPSDVPVQYNFLRQGWPFPWPYYRGRVFVVTRETGDDQTVEQVLAACQIDAQNLGPPRLLKQFDGWDVPLAGFVGRITTCRVYLMERRPPAATATAASP